MLDIVRLGIIILAADQVFAITSNISTADFIDSLDNAIDNDDDEDEPLMNSDDKKSVSASLENLNNKAKEIATLRKDARGIIT